MPGLPALISSSRLILRSPDEAAAGTPAVPPEPAQTGRVLEQDIQRELKDSYLTYAMSTIMDRALPDVRDGLKPSQRRILWHCFKMRQMLRARRLEQLQTTMRRHTVCPSSVAHGTS